MREIVSSVSRGDSITDTIRSVARALGTPGQLTGKAETIARTETLTAVSIGQAAAMKNAKEVIPGLKKVWLTAGDNRVRDSHAELNGDTIPTEEQFSNGLNYPRDTEALDPAEVINCRCTLLIIPPGETLEIPK
jgi:SPP1 gp7 family putative phage head morphogenesis protein